LDKITDINKDREADKSATVRIETHRSGVFHFRVGVDMQAIQPLLDRVEDAHRRFSSVPVLPVIANRLEKEVVTSSVFGTNTIEGGTLTEEETREVLSRDVDAAQVADVRERSVVNLREAYWIAERVAADADSEKPRDSAVMVLMLRDFMFKDLHRVVTQGLSEPGNTPGAYRDNQKGLSATKVGDKAHGGVYTPPKCLDDITLLMDAFLKWVNSDAISDLSPLIRAPLIHYYFERIHPFGNGNGRVGRVVEAMVLLSAGYRFAPFALSSYYVEHVDEYYVAFRQAEKADKAKQALPNTLFIELFLQGMLDTLNRLHDRVNVLLGTVLFENQLNAMLTAKQINSRQYATVTNLPAGGIALADLRNTPWYQGLYHSLTSRTRERDLKKLQDLELITIDATGRVAVVSLSGP